MSVMKMMTMITSLERGDSESESEPGDETEDEEEEKESGSSYAIKSCQKIEVA